MNSGIHWKRRGLRVLEMFFGLITRKYMGTIKCVSTTEPVVALTFDDGPDPSTTPKLLEMLERYESKATFFMVGELAEDYPFLVKQVADAGHAIGNHSWNHPSFPAINVFKQKSQILACAKHFHFSNCKLFRPPFGHQNISSNFLAFLLGYQVIAWNLAAFDWLDKDSEWIADKLLKNIYPGSIILLHDSIYKSHLDKPQYNRQVMFDALEEVFSKTKNQFRFLTVPDLLRQGKPVRVDWFIRGHQDW